MKQRLSCHLCSFVNMTISCVPGLHTGYINLLYTSHASTFTWPYLLAVSKVNHIKVLALISTQEVRPEHSKVFVVASNAMFIEYSSLGRPCQVFSPFDTIIVISWQYAMACVTLVQ